jgi:hypothetical protein
VQGRLHTDPLLAKHKWLKKADADLDGSLTFFSFCATDLIPELQAAEMLPKAADLTVVEGVNSAGSRSRGSGEGK